MPREVMARRFSGDGSIGLWPREFEQGAPLMYPDYPWVAAVEGEERIFPTFRDAVDWLYFQTRHTGFREPATEEFTHDQGES